MDLQWVPHKPDQLITWAQDIILYRVEDVRQSVNQSGNESAVKGPSIQISPTQTATQLVKLKEYPYPKVVDCYPGTDADGMIAVGLGNGKVVLTSFGETIINKEFVPKHTRQINSLCWNKNSPNLLAAGLDKARSDQAVLIWDINAAQTFTNGFHSDALRSELGHSETAQSVAWVTAKTLLVGMNGKHIKLFDLRDIQPKLERTASTKAVYGISVDGNQRVASFADNQAYVWDMRNLDKPFVVLNHNKNISRIGWCPTRSGLLACLEKDSFHVQLHDVHHAAMSSEEGEPAVLDRSLTPSYMSSGMSTSMSMSANGPTPSAAVAAAQITSFAWHPTEENVLTTKSASGILWNSVVYERVTLNWSPTSKLCWSNGKKMIQYIDNTDDVYAQLDDISVKMKQRALVGYGIKKGLRENCSLVHDDGSLRHLWEWLDYCHNVTDRDKYRVPFIGNVKFPGVRTVLRMDAGSKTEPMKSEVIINNSFDLSNNKKTYQSEERKFVQALCGWDSDSGTGETPSCASRKAAIALFHLKMRQCIRILSDSGHEYWPIVATAIAGFNEDRSSLWREMAQVNFTKLNDPYIRAIFAFLTETDNNYDLILNETGVDLADRVGFACSFLNDAKLINFIQEVTNDMTRKGDLSGVLLTGMTPSVLPLLQRYLDMTGDVQTVSLLAIRTMPIEISTINQLKFWIERYRDLLNSWKLWEARAEFDICKNSNNPALIPQPKVTVSCSFCGKNISTVGLGSLNRPQMFSRFTTTNAKLKLSCCPSCRKPLPRCAICLLHMGTVLGSSTEPIRELQKTGASPEALSWYTWCQTCFHGGHTIHLQQWFCTQAECPVSGCSCKCSSLDKIVEFPH